jgi:hypothetical protein
MQRISKRTMTEDLQGRKNTRTRLWLALALLVTILAVLVVPPMVSIARYKNGITRLMSSSLGRPVHLSSVELRLLPRPGFVLNDLTVDEDPGFGAEPFLHANTVRASIRLFPLWRGRLEVDTISVDEASVNLVRNDAGRWNLDSLFRTAAAKTGQNASGTAVPLPYLKATNSRINVKRGAEKLPYSLVDTDVSFWQENPGDWRLRLRGQPARTDVNLELGDTGIVRMELSLKKAAELRLMPVHMDLEWREAQLGQLSRLIIGSDPGWRGDLTGELHLDGNAETAQVKTRLRAIGVHRAEFAPASPLDFDARCDFAYHFSIRALQNLRCDSPLGNGQIRVAGDLPGADGRPHFSVELDKIPVDAGLDALRTMRSGFGPGLEAKGTVSGKITYAEVTPDAEAAFKTVAKPGTGKGHAAKAAEPQGPLTGSFTVEGFELSGDGLQEPIRIAKLALEPVAAAEGAPSALTATTTIPAGGASPLTVTAQLALSGYQLEIHGQASVAKARELAKIAGSVNAGLLDAIAGEPLVADLSVEGPWQPQETISYIGNAVAGSTDVPAASGSPTTDRVSGTVALHNANWKADHLASDVVITSATLHLENGQVRWDPVVFVYGPVKGTVALTLPAHCVAPQPCLPEFQMQFAQLDASSLQAAVLGAKQKVTLISTLLEKLRPTASPLLPEMTGTVKAESLLLGPLTLKDVTADVHVLVDGVHVTSLDAAALGGKVHVAGSLYTSKTEKDKPSYMFEAQVEKLNPAQVGLLVGQRWSGESFDANGKVELSGFTQKDLADSAKGTLHFDWLRGTVGGVSVVPADLARFSKWSADAVIGGGAITLKDNQVERLGHSTTVQADATLGASPKVRFAAPVKDTQAKR